MSKKYQLYIAERAKGKTYQQIADQFGVTRQCVQAACTTIHKPRKPYGDIPCVYPVLRNWLEKHEITVAELYRRVYKIGTNTRPTSFRNHMKGNGRLTLNDIKCLIDITQIPFEKLFSV